MIWSLKAAKHEIKKMALVEIESVWFTDASKLENRASLGIR